MTPTNTEKPQTKPEVVKIDRLDDLKKELGFPDLDTSNDDFFKEKEIHLQISRGELKDLQAQMIWTNPEKLKKLKEIINEQQLVIVKTWKETWKLQDEIELLEKTPKWMEKAFELIKDNQEPQKYLIISQILNVFVYKNWFSIQKWGFLESISIVDENWKEQKEYSEIMNKYTSKDTLKKVFVFETSKSWNFEGRALEIANKYQINLRNGNKAEIRTQILSNDDIKQEEQMILLSYIDNDYKDVEVVANKYFVENNQNINNNRKTLEKATWIEFTKESMADYARNPDKLVGDVVREIWKNPLLLFSTIGLILWKIFWFKVWKDWSFLMNLLAVWAWVWAYKAVWAGKYLGDLIEWKDWPKAASWSNQETSEKPETEELTESQKEATKRVTENNEFVNLVNDKKEKKTQDYINYINSPDFQNISNGSLFYNNTFEENIFSNSPDLNKDIKLPTWLEPIIFKKILRQYLIGNYNLEQVYWKKPWLKEFLDFEQKYLPWKKQDKDKKISEILKNIYAKK